MNTVIKLIMHGLASGRVRSTPQLLEALKELKRGDPAAGESESASGTHLDRPFKPMPAIVAKAARAPKKPT